MFEGTLKGGPAIEVLVAVFSTAMDACGGTLGVREAAALDLANELVRRWLEGELAGLASRYDDEVVVDGLRYKRHSEGSAPREHPTGPVELKSPYQVVFQIRDESNGRADMRTRQIQTGVAPTA